MRYSRAKVTGGGDRVNGAEFIRQARGQAAHQIWVAVVQTIDKPRKVQLALHGPDRIMLIG